MRVEHFSSEPSSRRKINGRSQNELVAELIYEVTGHKRDRKTVSAHIQVLKTFSSRKKLAAIEARSCWSESPVLDGDPTDLTQFLNCGSSNPLSIFEEPPLPRRNTRLTRNTLSLSLVNHLFRTECIEYLASNTRFDFGSNRHTLQHFCSTAPADLIMPMRHVMITMVEGYMPLLPDWPDLRTLDIELWPRNPARPEVKDREWGWQTEELLASLGVILAPRAKITLEMRWAADCERFERAYVEHGRWTRIRADVEDCPPGRDEGFCRRRYEMHGNGDISVEEKEMQKDFSATIGRLVGLLGN